MNREVRIITFYKWNNLLVYISEECVYQVTSGWFIETPTLFINESISAIGQFMFWK